MLFLHRQMSKTIKEIFTGMLLGDGHIRRSGLNKAYITFEQSTKKPEYFNYVHNLLEKEGISMLEVKEYSRFDARYNSTTNSLRFSTKAIEELKPLAEMFLDEEGNKKIPSNIKEHLTHRSLAHWIMDDGQQVKRGGVTLCTDSYKPEEISLLREALKTNFNAITSIHKKKGSSDSVYERIYINKDSLEELKPFLKQHIHETMLYKINENANNLNTSGELNENLNKKIENDIGSDIGSDIGDF
jgi:hypothetical protein